jgi:ParB-like nuclease domain
MTDDMQIHLVDPAEVEPDEGVDPAARPDIDFLDASLEEKGQQVPVVIARHPAPVGQYKYKMIEGTGRRYCLLKRRRMMTAIILDRVPSESERIELDFTFNAIRRSMGLAEIAVKAERHMEINGCTQKETAGRLKCSDTTISRALTVTRRIPPEHRAAALRLGPYFVSLISPLPTPEAMGQAIAFADTPRPDGRKPSRAQIVAFVDGLKGKKPARGRRLKLRVENRQVEIELKPGDSAETLIEAFKAALGRLQEHRKLPLDAVLAAMADREPSAA